jgi:Xaa-Pro aminopeptidase
MSIKKRTESAASRIAQVRAAMKKSDVDALIITDLPSIRYLVGFSGSTATLILTKKNILFFTNDLYTVQVEQELYALDGLKVTIDRDPWKVIKTGGSLSRVKRLGFLPGRTSVALHKTIKASARHASLIAVEDLVTPVTQIKTKVEISEIAKAAQIASTAYEKMLGVVEPGMTERHVANILAATTRELGSERDAFDIIVVAGARSAMPHGRATDAKLKKGDPVTVDFGCSVNGMHSDMTRTFSVGTPSELVVDVFAVLYDAHLSSLDAAQAGITGKELDAVARDIITRAGYGENFRHSLGHGLGYEVHEQPSISRVNTSPLPENCVITIEPGIYLPGKFGMRIEDDVVIGKNGATILTTAPRELVVV